MGKGEREWVASGGGERGWSWKHLCICARVCRGASAGGPVLSPQWGDRWFPWGGAGQAQACLERTIVLVNEVWLPHRGGPICLHCFQQQPWELATPQGLTPQKTYVGVLSWGAPQSPHPPTQRLPALCFSLPVSHAHLLARVLTSATL